MTQFSDLKLDPKVLKAIDEAGYTTPTPIQEGAIPPALEGRDVLGIAQTGTGKTASFTLPMITLLGRGRARARMPRSLVLCPTRELAAQVAENFDIYARHTRLTKALLIGGVSMRDQEQLIDRGVDVLIATPGRLLDHFERGNLLLQGVQIMVVDEADRMLDMGFIPDIERIFQLTPFSRQTLFFSATMAPEIERITNTFLHTPVRIEVARQATTSETITQKLVELTPTRKDQTAKQKRELLRALIDAEGDALKNAIVFCNRKTEVDIVAKSLKAHGYDAAPIHGDLEQRQRMATLDGFRDGTLRFLIASDVAARGLDIPAVSHVFNFDLPSHAEDYVHRIGRTGRAGRLGTAISIATPADDKYLSAIESLVKQSLPRAALPEGFSLSDDAQKAPREPRDAGRGASAGGRSRTRSRRSEPRRDDAARDEVREERPRVRAAAGDDNGLPPAIETVTEGGRVDLPETRSSRGDRRRGGSGEGRSGGEQGGRRDDRREDRRDERREDRNDNPRNGRRDDRGEGRGEERRDDRGEGRGDRNRDDRRDRYRERDRGPAVMGLGDHVPDFMLTSFRSAEAAQPSSDLPASEEARADDRQLDETPVAAQVAEPITTPASVEDSAEGQNAEKQKREALDAAEQKPAEPKKPARRRSRAKAEKPSDDAGVETSADAPAGTVTAGADPAPEATTEVDAPAAEAAAEPAEKPAPKRRTRARKTPAVDQPGTEAPAGEGEAEAGEAKAPARKRATRSRKKKDAEVVGNAPESAATPSQDTTATAGEASDLQPQG